MTEEDAFWAAIGSNPADSLPRLVFADWLDENPRHDCPKCHGAGHKCDGHSCPPCATVLVSWRILPCTKCHHCEGPGRPRGRRTWRGAAATAKVVSGGHDRGAKTSTLTRTCSASCRWTECEHATTTVYPAEAAIRDLCRAWVASRKQEVVS